MPDGGRIQEGVGLERARLHRVTFDDPGRVLSAVRALSREGFEIAEVHSPFPIHGLPEAMGLPDTRLGWATLAGGLAGALGMLFFQGWVHTSAWPMDIGGKSDLAWPALIPAKFEVAVLLAAFATLLGLFVARRLYPRLDGGAPGQPLPAVTDDRFCVLVLERDASFSLPRFRAVCESLEPIEVAESWRVA